MGVLHSRALMLMKVEGNQIVERKPIWLGKYQRVRDVQQGPDGWIYVAVQSPEGTIIRLVP
ncbi:PQQ-dependent sugar dehydrogenase [Granulosicoccus antarcticus]|uniref:Soluble aldose sugar dehydrogenase YliI n=1 Tax=Granulosicoccus antarcticus IMCC3135 TaxID=1192854 RepID=A0A2Z2NTH5_9GAMM|nr:PQQ-dependent sugar dehydrogenase [Granulosicoccus antarcticus]ASJ74796.1 Soluble aldose sugar dehydrogenase YliI [Granulosicoccus antarcticus IMCC3135]